MEKLDQSRIWWRQGRPNAAYSRKVTSRRRLSGTEGFAFVEVAAIDHGLFLSGSATAGQVEYVIKDVQAIGGAGQRSVVIFCYFCVLVVEGLANFFGWQLPS